MSVSESEPCLYYKKLFTIVDTVHKALLRPVLIYSCFYSSPHFIRHKTEKHRRFGRYRIVLMDKSIIHIYILWFRFDLIDVCFLYYFFIHVPKQQQQQQQRLRHVDAVNSVPAKGLRKHIASDLLEIETNGKKGNQLSLRRYIFSQSCVRGRCFHSRNTNEDE